MDYEQHKKAMGIQDASIMIGGKDNQKKKEVKPMEIKWDFSWFDKASEIIKDTTPEGEFTDIQKRYLKGEATVNELRESYGLKKIPEVPIVPMAEGLMPHEEINHIAELKKLAECEIGNFTAGFIAQYISTNIENGKSLDEFCLQGKIAYYNIFVDGRWIYRKLNLTTGEQSWGIDSIEEKDENPANSPIVNVNANTPVEMKYCPACQSMWIKAEHAYICPACGHKLEDNEEKKEIIIKPDNTGKITSKYSADTIGAIILDGCEDHQTYGKIAEEIIEYIEWCNNCPF